MAQAHEMYSMYAEAADPRHDLRARVLGRRTPEVEPQPVPTMMVDPSPQINQQHHHPHHSMAVMNLAHHQQLPSTSMTESRGQHHQQHGPHHEDDHQDRDGPRPKKTKTLSNKPVWSHTYVQNNERYCRHCNSALSVHSTRIRRHLLELCRMISDVDKQNLIEETQRGVSSASIPRGSEPPRRKSATRSTSSSGKATKSHIIKEILRHTTVTDADSKLRVCNYCNGRVAYDHPTRIRKHILSSCQSVPPNIKFYLYGLYSNSEDLPPPPFPRRSSAKNSSKQQQEEEESSSSASDSWSDSDSNESDASDGSDASTSRRRRSIARARKNILGHMILGGSHANQSHDQNISGDQNQLIPIGQAFDQGASYQSSEFQQYQQQYCQSGQGPSGDAAGPSVETGGGSGGSSRAPGDQGLPLSLDGLKEYVERLDQMIAGLCRIRTRVCRSILTRHRSDTEFRNAIGDLKRAVDKGITANMVI